LCKFKNQMTLAEENYIKAIFHLERELQQEISTNAIADVMHTKPSSVTDMIKKLAEKSLLSYKKYQGVTLTDEGKKVAAIIIRKHRLWEVFLVDKLNFQWDEVHDIAEQLEHIKAPELINRLDEFLGFPEVDPHGDPIPDKEGKFKKTQKVLLFEMQVSQQGICVGVKETDPSFLQYLDKIKLHLGSKIEVLEKESFDGSFKLKSDGNMLFISKPVAENIYVKKTIL